MKTTFNIFVLLALIMGVSSFTVPVPRGAIPENIIAVGGGNFLMSDMPTGNVMLFNIISRQFYTVVTAPPGRLIQGLAYDKKRDLIITTGSGPPYAQGANANLATGPNVANVVYPVVGTAMNIYEKSSGKPFAQCNATGAILMKDVAIDSSGNFAYFTDAFRALIYKLDLNQLPNCVVSIIDMPSFPEFSGGNTFYTGIGAYRNGLIINSFSAQLSIFLNPNNGKTVVLAKGDGGQGGLKVRGNCLLVTDALNQEIDVYQLYKNRSTNFSPRAVRTRTITDDSFDMPTGLALSGRTTVSPNLNLGVIGRTGSLSLAIVELPKTRRGFC